MTLRLNGSTSGYVEIDAPATAGSNTLVLPNGNGTNGQYLQTAGNGVLSWATVSSTVYQGPTFAATTSVNQNFSASTWTKAQFDTELFDTDNCFDIATNYRFTPTKAGYYQVSATAYVDYNSGASNIIGGALYKNGSSVAKYFKVAASTYYGAVPVSQVLHLNGSTDYVEFFVWSNASSPYLYAGGVAGGDGRIYFSATWVHS